MIHQKTSFEQSNLQDMENAETDKHSLYKALTDKPIWQF
jgi:hypothetical protein